MSVPKSGLSRREFLRISGLMAGGAYLTAHGLLSLRRAAAQASGDLSYLQDTSPITFSMYSDRGWHDSWGGPNQERITAKTGVRFDVQHPAQDDYTGQDVALLLASNSLPDLLVLDVTNAIYSQLIEGGHILPLNALIDEHAPGMRKILDEQWGPEILQVFQEGDGNTYKLVSGYPTQFYRDIATANAGLAPNWLPVFVTTEALYQEAGAPDTSTPEGFEAFLTTLKELYPDKVPFLGYQNQFQGSLGPFRYQFGIPPYYLNGGKLQHPLRDPRSLEGLVYMNRLAGKELLTRATFIAPEDVTRTNINSGVAMVAPLNSDDWLNDRAVPFDAATTWRPLPVFGSYAYPMIANGFMMTMITKACKDPARLVRFLEYLASVEGMTDMFLGVPGDAFGDMAEGPHFFYDKELPNVLFPEGKPTYFDEWWDVARTDWGKMTSESGLYKGKNVYITNWAIENQPMWNPKNEKQAQYSAEMSPRMVWYPEYAFQLDGTSEAAIAKARIDELALESIPAIVFAPEGDVQAMYDDFIAQAEGLGLETLEAEWTRLYEANSGRSNG